MEQALPAGLPVRGQRRFRALFAAVLLWPALLPASQFNVSPVKLTLPAAARSTSLTVTNTDDKPVALQIQLYHWDKDRGVDRQAPAQDLLVTPPVLKLAPGKAQVVRVGRPAGIPVPEIEQAYRVVVTELALPGAPAPGSATVLKTLLEVSVPLFVPPARIERGLDWALAVDGQVARLLVQNAGTVHGRLTELRLRDSDGAVLAESQRLVYALPRQLTRIDIPVSRPLRPGEALKLEYRLDHALRSLDLRVPGP